MGNSVWSESRFQYDSREEIVSFWSDELVHIIYFRNILHRVWCSNDSRIAGCWCQKLILLPFELVGQCLVSCYFILRWCWCHLSKNKRNFLFFSDKIETWYDARLLPNCINWSLCTFAWDLRIRWTEINDLTWTCYCYCYCYQWTDLCLAHRQLIVEVMQDSKGCLGLEYKGRSDTEWWKLLRFK